MMTMQGVAEGGLVVGGRAARAGLRHAVWCNDVSLPERQELSESSHTAREVALIRTVVHSCIIAAQGNIATFICACVSASRSTYT